MAARKSGNTKGKAQGPVQPSGKRAEDSNAPAAPETSAEISGIDGLQMVLDLAGMIPGAGAVPDLINAAISLMRGDFVGALFSAGSAVPVIGDAAGAAKIIKNGEKYMQAVAAVEKKVLPHLPAPMRKKVEAYLAKVRAKLDEMLKKEKPEKPADRKAKSKDDDGVRSQGSSGGRCKLEIYDKGCPSGQTPHHVVPDHCFRMPASQGGAAYPGTERITKGNGLCICVGGPTKSTGQDGTSVKRAAFKGSNKVAKWFGALAEHGKIHALMDAQEAALGAANNPKRTATLGQLEEAGARSAGMVTGCDPKDLRRQLREHHQKNGLPESTRLRADPFGKNPPPKTTAMGTNQGGISD